MVRRALLVVVSLAALVAVSCTAWSPLRLDATVERLWREPAVPVGEGARPRAESWHLVAVTARGPVHLVVPLLTYARLEVGRRVILVGEEAPSGGRAVFHELVLPHGRATGGGESTPARSAI